jgi:hypothetical protein
MRRVVLLVSSSEVGGECGTLPGASVSTRSSFPPSSCIISLSIRFWFRVGGAILCFLNTSLESSSAGVWLVFPRFRFPRGGSLDTRAPLSDAREITGESVARLLDLREARGLLEPLSAGLLDVGVAVARGFLDLLGADAMVNVYSSAKRNQAHLDGHLSSSRLSLLPKLQ